jgi:hypothetical protein
MKYLHKRGVSTRRFGNRRPVRQFLLLAAAFGVAVTAASFNMAGNRASATVPGTNVRASLSAAGAQSSTGSYQSTMSRNGQFVAFYNNQNNFVGTDTNNKYDVFVRDVFNNTTTRASVSTAGTTANSDSTVVSISETGRYVVFTSKATNLIDGRTISSTDPQLYIRDMTNNTTTLLTEVSAGTFANGDTTFPYDVSSDGRFVLFGSTSTNLGPTITTTGWHIHVFLLDTATNTVTWVDEKASGAGNPGNDPYNAAMSCDGSFVVLDSSTTYMGVGSSAHTDVFLVDLRNGKLVTDITQSGNGAAMKPRISCNGNYIGFVSTSNNLDPLTAGLTTYYHAYSYDRINGTFDLLDQNSSSTLANSPVANLATQRIELSLSDSGVAVFMSTATNLDTAAASGKPQLFLRNPSTGITELLTRDTGGTEGNNVSNDLYAVLSLDGKRAAYESEATNLVGSDTNSSPDIFVSDTGL